MMWYGDGMGGWGFVLMAVSTVVFWGALIAGGIALFRYLNRTAANPEPATPGPLPSNCSPNGSPAVRSTTQSTGNAWTRSAARGQPPEPDSSTSIPAGPR
jgi:hypothetical protein